MQAKPSESVQEQGTGAGSPTGLVRGCSLPTEALLAIMNTHGSATPRPRFLARSQDPTGSTRTSAAARSCTS